MILIDNPDMNGQVGIIFNKTDGSNYCILEISNGGTFRIWKKMSGVSSEVVASTFSTAINSGLLTNNTIQIIQNSTTVKVMVNNTSVGTFNVALPTGNIQVGVTTSTHLAPVTGLFNNFIIEKL